MPADADRYERYYADKLWKLLPAIYRSEDTYSFDHNGPLRELVNRIGAQAAILRRGIDRLWDDQSIETCDDWVVAYIGDLLATNLVSSQDARGQRIDVAKTIYYRRRKGTVALLEELAADITGWDARVVEFFRRMGRTRHGFDPEIGIPAETTDPAGDLQLQFAEGLVGKLSRTGIGGWADLRNAYAATKSQSAFDEFFHTADFRRGRGMVGWHNIPRLGVFLWRLRSFGVDQTNPVPVKGCPDHYTFDPTGREIPLFAESARAFGDLWISPEEWQLPTPISTPLLTAALADPAHEPLYAAINPADGITVLLNSMGVFRRPGSFYNLVPASQTVIYPETGRFKTLGAPPNDAVFTTYHYGFSSTIGAGPYDRRVLRSTPTPQPGTRLDVSGGANQLTAPLAAVAPTGTVSIDDSLTYAGVSDVAGIKNVTLMAQNEKRPLIRLAPPAAWTLTGTDGSVLYLDGLFVSGMDIVLKGKFDQVTINCCSFDPGQADDVGHLGQLYAKAVDGQDLQPSNLWVEAQIKSLNIARSILGPVGTRLAGEIETLTISDSILQSVDAVGPQLFDAADLVNPGLLAVEILDGADPVIVFIRGALTPATKLLLTKFVGSDEPDPALIAGFVQDINTLVVGPSVYDVNRFKGVTLSAAVLKLITLAPAGDDLKRLNRLLLKAALPAELLERTDLALSLINGTVHLERTTVLGPAAVHRLHASECILDDLFFVDNAQDGCTRFTAWSVGSVLPRKYECVRIAPGAALFTSRAFGQPGYAQLTLGVDRLIVNGANGATISAGAENGSEMGAFAREMNPIKERSLRIKYDEFMPLGLIPVLVYVT